MAISYSEWAARWPQAASELAGVLVTTTAEASEGKSESSVQQQIRFDAAQQGGVFWRNNVGATPTRCINPKCNAKAPPVRYGLCNDSPALNAKVKSADLIGIVPRLITQAMVGGVIGQFASIEVKKQGWKFTGRGREAGQAAWATLILGKGGFATFSTGDVKL
jgi:hypothetical protein